MKVYIGYDRRESIAYSVAVNSLRNVSNAEYEAIDGDRLRRTGLLTRVNYVDNGRRYDAASEATVSTDFAISRFLTPILCQRGYALFTDCDVVFLRDVNELLSIVDPQYAVSVVKHNYDPSTATKMDDQIQTRYSRKNWSSVMLFNCDHPANARLSVHDINTRTGRDLHALYWLHDSEIGSLPPEWNWLVGEQPKPEAPGIAHFTLGGPWLPKWKPAEHDEIWTAAFDSLCGTRNS